MRVRRTEPVWRNLLPGKSFHPSTLQDPVKKAILPLREGDRWTGRVFLCHKVQLALQALGDFGIEGREVPTTVKCLSSRRFPDFYGTKPRGLLYRGGVGNLLSGGSRNYLVLRTDTEDPQSGGGPKTLQEPLGDERRLSLRGKSVLNG